MIYFVRTEHHYAPYDDFFRLAELSGYPIIYVNEMLEHDSKDTIFVISPVNAEWNQRPKGYTQGRVILWMLEWNIDGEHNIPQCVNEVWNSDKRHSDLNGFRYIPMGSHSGLNVSESPLQTNKYFDVAMISYQTYRRQIVTQQLRENGLELAPISGIWQKLRSDILLQSRVLLHVHQEEATAGVAPLRWCLAAAHGLPLISETVPDRGVFGYTYMMQADYVHLAAFTAHMLKDTRALSDYALALQGFLCRDYTFERSVSSHV